jgi:hypothetical protein
MFVILLFRSVGLGHMRGVAQGERPEEFSTPKMNDKSNKRATVSFHVKSFLSSTNETKLFARKKCFYILVLNPVSGAPP